MKTYYLFGMKLLNIGLSKLALNKFAFFSSSQQEGFAKALEELLGIFNKPLESFMGAWLVGKLAKDSGVSQATIAEAGGIFFPLATAVQAVAQKAFDAMGWQPSQWRNWTEKSLVIISSAALAAKIAVELGLVSSIKMGLLSVASAALYVLAPLLLVRSVAEAARLMKKYRDKRQMAPLAIPFKPH
ncbi:hypothetical protein [Candidatus Protochlamydia phocaeensis]|uniref:hypothetical protein n=1 Tax=Candidatus Protochlamydia phocaeensis TaxID=1414722 RepID=UPI0008388B0A|nr:hypothetical protein [Candidatus Protochlamydia phocaeensis]